MLNIYVFCVLITFITSFNVDYLHGAFLNNTDLNNLKHQLQRTIRQINVEECVRPTIPNGNINIIRQKVTAKRNFLSINITCDDNYILQPRNDFYISCFNGFWDVDEIPECKRCVKRSDNTDIDENFESSLICPESFHESRIYKECGQRLDKTHQPFVINGTVSKFAEFPWHVAIYRKEQNFDPIYHCGGSIINDKNILTVAHCFTDDYGKIVTTREYYAGAGKYHIKYISDSQSSQLRKIMRTNIHPRYRGELTNHAWDIAVVTVNEPFEISTLVHPVCIDWKTQFENEHLAHDKYGEVAGWGKSETNLNTAASELRVLKVPFIEAKQCVTFVPNTFLKYITPDKFCAGFINGSSVCNGDSGGGLVFERQENGKSKYYIRGLVSVGLQKEGRCDEYKYSTYTKVSDYITFIREAIENKDNSTVTTFVSPKTSLLKIVVNSTEPSTSCKTPNNEESKCVSIYDCKIFINALQNSPTKEVIKYMKDSICGEKSEKKVCCGSTINYLSIINSNPVTSRPHKPIWEDKVFSNILPPPGVCGRQVIERRRRIYGGTMADLYDYPWMALLEFGTPEKSAGFLCTGFLINERYVITAAHCAKSIRSSDSGRLFRVRLGEYNTDTKIDCIHSTCADPPLDVDVEEILVHPSYNRVNLSSDIALLRLARVVSYTDFIKPICLPLNGETSLPGKKILTAGWGQTEIGYSPVKLKTTVYATSQEACNLKYAPNQIKILDSHVCAVGENGNGDCRGDTGGPFMSTLTNSKDIYAEGVVSFGSKNCGSDYPTVATRLTSFIDWILESIRP